MKYRFRIGFLLLVLFAAVTAPEQARACGSDNGDHAAGYNRQESNNKSCCNPPESAPSTDACHHPDASSGCPCDHNSGGCHCPGCGVVSSGGAAFTAETTPLFVSTVFSPAVRKAAFYFSDHLPQAVYLPIWQPPRSM